MSLDSHVSKSTNEMVAFSNGVKFYGVKFKFSNFKI